MSFLSTHFRPLARGGWGGKAASHWRGGSIAPAGMPWRGQIGTVIYRGAGSTQQYAFSGVTRNSVGAALGSCTVALFRTLNDELIAKTTSDASGLGAALDQDREPDSRSQHHRCRSCRT